ncbi:hypothetical protein FRB93_001313 [Tulasnella sp. JGI-2019a]|nr:hypothetical protein FRB93_001313 [Tulasnella sp. JGI-2019a]
MRKGDISSRFADPGLFVYETLDERSLKLMGIPEGEIWTSNETSPPELDVHDEDDMIMSSEDESPLVAYLSRMGPMLHPSHYYPEVNITLMPNVNIVAKPTPVISAPIGASRAIYSDGTVYNNGFGQVVDEGNTSDSHAEVDTAADEGGVAQPTSPASPGRENTNSISSVVLRAQARGAVNLALRSVAERCEQDVSGTTLRDEVLNNSQKSLGLERTEEGAQTLVVEHGTNDLKLSSHLGEVNNHSVSPPPIKYASLSTYTPPLTKYVPPSTKSTSRSTKSASLSTKSTSRSTKSASLSNKRGGQRAKLSWVFGPNGLIIPLGRKQAQTDGAVVGTETTSILEEWFPIVRRWSFDCPDDCVRDVKGYRPNSTPPAEAVFHHEQVPPPTVTAPSLQSLPLRAVDHKGKNSGVKAPEEVPVTKDTSSSAPSTKVKGGRKTTGAIRPPSEKITQTHQSHHQPDRDQLDSRLPARGGHTHPNSRFKAQDHTNQFLSSSGGKKGNRAASESVEGGFTGSGRGSGRTNAGRGVSKVPSIGRGGVPSNSESPSGTGVASPSPSKSWHQIRSSRMAGKSSSRNAPKNDHASDAPAINNTRPTEAPTEQVMTAGHRRHYVAVPPSWEAWK